MIFDELVVHNVGVFGGRHTFTLTPPSESKPVILIGALNGSGKTTFLDAIQLALFGPLARTTSRGSGSYPLYLRRLIHNGVPPEDGASVELAFHIIEEGKPRHYRVCRSWTGNSSGARERLEVLVDNVHDGALSRHWAERVDVFVPRGVAELFFFDGEKIETLAELDNARDMLRTAIGSLLGLDLPDRLSADLAVIERNYKTAQAPPAMKNMVDLYRKQLMEARQRQTDAKHRVAEAHEADERAEKVLYDVEVKINLEGGELLEQRQDLQKTDAILTAAVKTLDARLQNEAAGVLPLLLVRDQLATLADQTEIELDHVQQRDVANILTARDRETVDFLKRHGGSAKALEALQRFLSSDRKAWRGRSQTRIAGLNHDDLLTLRQLTGSVLDEHAATVRDLINERNETVANLEDTKRSMQSVPSDEALVDLHELRRDAHRISAAATQELSQAEGELNKAIADAAAIEKRLSNFLDKAADEIAEADDARRIIEHSQRVRLTLARFREEATRRNVDRIQKLILDSLQRLARKDRLITNIEINPATFEVELHGRDGTVLLPQQLSAGERQLLAVSMLWGLAQASGRPLPVVIDTPLGRLDGVHRNHLIERYFPQASHQVILLSTDQEIDETAMRKLSKHVGHSYTLSHDAASGATNARTGYLW
ncbi:DNA sulfur modification protein DndD [Actinokineospora cianjurensis]|uniref:Nuclease SbcCD subunit C n=1 Tax=Actinokineospora cianjurensis TaxID=585224 RepID=A0A421B5D9_9PSEU|nr:DNA sulfur modification protein DndD [Actinokineospora cianjurensis]RLK59597.1 DNA sulfur modification protein DndD [Actinokineospora cianjurensis]